MSTRTPSASQPVTPAESQRASWRTVSSDVRQVFNALERAGEPGEVHVVYEAGPTGYGLYRELCKRGYRCEIVAPSLIPRRPGDRIKNDRRDCARLVELARAGELKAIWVPDEEHESVRDLCRAREDAVSARLNARQQLKAFLLQHDRRYPGTTSWNKRHAIWIAEQRFDHADERLALAEYQLAVQVTEQRVERLTTSLSETIKGWRFEPVVAALRGLRGIDVVSAVRIVAEIGDINRFGSARGLMGYLAWSVGAFQRQQRTTWLYHQDRQRPRQTTADGGSLELSVPRKDERRAPSAQRGLTASGARPRLEGPVALEQALLAAVVTRCAVQRGLRRRGARTRWLCLGDRSTNLAHIELNERKRPAAMRGSFTIGRTLNSTMCGRP